jgi:hypothetical protein
MQGEFHPLSPTLATLSRSGEATLKAIVMAGQPITAMASCCKVMVPLAVSIALGRRPGHRSTLTEGSLGPDSRASS